MSTENERLGKEVAALRALLAAVRDLANVPYPAGYDDIQRYYIACANRIDSIAIYANPDRTVGEGPRTAPMLRSAAEDLRREAARPLRYTPKSAGPEPEPDSRRYCESVAPHAGRRCTEQGPHGKHRNGMVVWQDEPPPADDGGVLLPAACDPDNAPAACSSHGGTAEPAACWECQAELRRADAILAEDAARYHGLVPAIDGALRFCASAPGHKFGCRDSDGHVIITAVEPDPTDAVEGEGSDLD